VASHRLAFGQDRHRRVVAMQTLGCQNMRLDQAIQRHGGEHPGPDLVGQRRDTQLNALAPEALALPIQGQMLAELVEQDRRQKRRPDEAAWRGMERRRRLRNRLAGAARELLAHRLDQLPPPRDYLQGLGHVLAKLRQVGRSAARTARRGGKDNPLAFNILREGLAHRPTTRERSNRLCRLGRRLGRQFVFCRRRFQLLQLQLELVEQPLLALRTLAVKLTA